MNKGPKFSLAAAGRLNTQGQSLRNPDNSPDRKGKPKTLKAQVAPRGKGRLNLTAKIIFKARKYDHVTPLLMELHWLPIKVRSSFKVLILTYKALHGLAPDYLRELLRDSWNLRSSHVVTLRTAALPKTKYGQRAFINLAPALWNGLPSEIRASETLAVFKNKLKAHYFTECYNQ